MKRSQRCARRIQNGLVCGLLLFGCCTMLPGCGNEKSDTKSESSKNKRADWQVVDAAKRPTLDLIHRQPYYTNVKSEELKIEKIRQSPDDPDTYFAKAVCKATSIMSKSGMFDIKIEFVGDMVQVTLLQ